MDTHKKVFENIDHMEIALKKKSVYISPMTHPWKKQSFEKNNKTYM